jgi:hypothetical protein
MFYRYWHLLLVLGGNFLSTASDIGGHAFIGLGSCGKPSSVLFSHGVNKAFLVPDSCRATESNGNSISADDTIENS